MVKILHIDAGIQYFTQNIYVGQQECQTLKKLQVLQIQSDQTNQN